MNHLLVCVADTKNGAKTEYLFDRSPVRLGRNALNDLCLPWSFISNWHAIVRFGAGRIEYLDLGSSNGTRLNGQRISKSAPALLDESDLLTIGHLKISLATTDRGGAGAGVAAHQAGRLAPNGPDATAVLAATVLPEAEGAAGDDRTVACVGGDAGNGGFGNAALGAQQVTAALVALKPAVLAYRQAWQQCFAQLQGQLAAAPPPLQVMLCRMAQMAFPEIGQERQWQSLLQTHKIALSAVDEKKTQESVQLAALRKFLRACGMEEGAQQGAEASEQALARVHHILEVFAGTFVQLRQGMRVFNQEMALNMFCENSPLQEARSAREVMVRLLQQRGDPVQELKRSFADIMIHQVALLRGVVDGVKSLLARLAPSQIGQEVQAEVRQAKWWQRWRWFGPWAVVARWRSFRAKYEELVDSDTELNAAIFGGDFARSYSEVSGPTTSQSSNQGHTRILRGWQ